MKKTYHLAISRAFKTLFWLRHHLMSLWSDLYDVLDSTIAGTKLKSERRIVFIKKHMMCYILDIQGHRLMVLVTEDPIL
jgi:hypothetical protein